MFEKVLEKLNIKKEKKVTLDELIQLQLEWVRICQDDLDPTKRYHQAMKDLDMLYGMKIKLKGLNKGAEMRIDPNTVIVVLGAIGEVLLIIHHEQTGAIVSKAFSRLLRPRL